MVKHSARRTLNRYRRPGRPGVASREVWVSTLHHSCERLLSLDDVRCISTLSRISFGSCTLPFDQLWPFSRRLTHGNRAYTSIHALHMSYVSKASLGQTRRLPCSSTRVDALLPHHLLKLSSSSLLATSREHPPRARTYYTRRSSIPTGANPPPQRSWTIQRLSYAPKQHS